MLLLLAVRLRWRGRRARVAVDAETHDESAFSRAADAILGCGNVLSLRSRRGGGGGGVCVSIGDALMLCREWLRAKGATTGRRHRTARFVRPPPSMCGWMDVIAEGAMPRLAERQIASPEGSERPLTAVPSDKAFGGRMQRPLRREGYGRPLSAAPSDFIAARLRDRPAGGGSSGGSDGAGHRHEDDDAGGGLQSHTRMATRLPGVKRLDESSSSGASASASSSASSSRPASDWKTAEWQRMERIVAALHRYGERLEDDELGLDSHGRDTDAESHGSGGGRVFDLSEADEEGDEAGDAGVSEAVEADEDSSHDMGHACSDELEAHDRSVREFDEDNMEDRASRQLAELELEELARPAPSATSRSPGGHVPRIAWYDHADHAAGEPPLWRVLGQQSPSSAPSAPETQQPPLASSYLQQQPREQQQQPQLTAALSPASATAGSVAAAGVAARTPSAMPRTSSRSSGGSRGSRGSRGSKRRTKQLPGSAAWRSAVRHGVESEGIGAWEDSEEQVPLVAQRREEREGLERNGVDGSLSADADADADELGSADWDESVAGVSLQDWMMSRDTTARTRGIGPL
jgi:hypothetical protein